MKKQRFLTAILSMIMVLVFVTELTASSFPIKASADNFEYAWFPVNQVRLTQLAFESASHSYSYHIDCVGANAVGSDYAFAPFTGKIVYMDPSWGYIGFQSTDASGNPKKIHWADGSLDIMTVWFMHGSNVSSLSKGQIIAQGTDFFREGSVGANAAHYKDQTGQGVGNYCGCGSDYPYNAFFLNRSKTPNIINPGKLQQRFVGGPNNQSDWTGLWKDLGTSGDSTFPRITYPSGKKPPEGDLNQGAPFGIYGTIESKLPIQQISAGIFRDGIVPVPLPDFFYSVDLTDKNVYSYNLFPDVDNAIIFNNLSIGSYVWKVVLKDSEDTKTVVETKFSIVKKDAVESSMTISDQTVPPARHPRGKFFGVYGNIQSKLPITKVYGGVYKSDGSKTAQYVEYTPTSAITQYSLYPYFDCQILFDDLPVGNFIYCIYASDTSGKIYKFGERAFEVYDDSVTPAFFKGIDVSSYQGSINWASVANTGVKFAIIRCATTNISDAAFSSDSKFETNYQGASNAGIAVGTYMYTSANSKSEMKSNVDSMLKIISGKSFTYPVYLDVEQAARQSDLGKESLTEVILYGLQLIKEAGYTAGVYANQNWFNNYVDRAKIANAGYEIWLARYPNGERPVDPAGYDYSQTAGVWQYSSKGSVAGISGNVDVDVAYKTFAPWYEYRTPANLGNSFDAIILNKNCWKPIRPDSNSNVVLYKEEGKNCEMWRFTHQSDGSYKIVNFANGLCLEASGAGTADGTNIITAKSNDTAAQRWFIYDAGEGGYWIRPAHTHMAMDLAGNDSSDNAQIHLWTHHGQAAQVFSLYRSRSDVIVSDYAKPYPLAPTLTVKSDTSIALSWNKTVYTEKYIVYRSKDNSTWIKVKEVTTPSFTDTGLAEKTKYYYKVEAVNRFYKVSSGSSSATTQKTPTYTVVFDNNGGSGSMSNQTIKRDQSVTLTANTLSRDGFIFKEWNTKSDGSGTPYADKASVKNLAAGGGTIVLYAQWTPKTVKVTFHRNQNANDTHTVTETFTYDVDNQRFGHKTDGTGRYSTMNEAYIGFGAWTFDKHSLIGWATDPNASDKTFSTYNGVGKTWIDKHSPSIDLYAVWKAEETPYQFKGSGTKDDPYQIGNKEELAAMRDLTNSLYYCSEYRAKHYILTSDIDLQNEEWEPIAKRFIDGTDTGCGLSGSFDGAHHSIMNINVVRGNEKFAGLFGALGKGGLIMSLSVTGSVRSTGNCVGGIVGELCSSDCAVMNCSFVGNVEGKEAVGGITGNLYQKASVINCYHIGTVKSMSGKSAGGIAGNITAAANTDGTSLIDSCYHVGKIMADSDQAALIAGTTEYKYPDKYKATIAIRNCYGLNGDCAANICVIGKVDENSSLVQTSSQLRALAEDLGSEFVKNPASDSYPVFYWQVNEEHADAKTTKTLLGDVDCSGEVNVADAVLLARFLGEDQEATVTAHGKINANVNGDGSVDSVDYSALLEFLAGINPI